MLKFLHGSIVATPKWPILTRETLLFIKLLPGVQNAAFQALSNFPRERITERQIRVKAEESGVMSSIFGL